MDMNDRIRAGLGHTPPPTAPEIAATLDARFRERFGDDADRKTPRTDDEQSWADTFAEVERDAPKPPGSPAPLPGGRMTGDRYGAPDIGPHESFSDVLRATHRSQRHGTPVSVELDRIDNQR